MASTIFQGDKVKALKNKLQLGESASLSSGNIDPSISGFVGNVGDVYISTLTGKLYVKENTGNFDWSPSTTASSLNEMVVDKYTLSATDISNKYVILSQAPVDKPDTKMTVIGGCEQNYGTSFVVTNDDGGKRLSWSGLDLDGLLEENDKIIVTYL